jgi:hypothetical protein
MSLIYTTPPYKSNPVRPAQRACRKTDAYLYVLKSRFDELGYPCRLALDYSLSEGRFKAADYKMSYE